MECRLSCTASILPALQQQDLVLELLLPFHCSVQQQLAFCLPAKTAAVLLLVYCCLIGCSFISLPDQDSQALWHPEGESFPEQ
jgi:hypothetical protein